MLSKLDICRETKCCLGDALLLALRRLAGVVLHRVGAEHWRNVAVVSLRANALFADGDCLGLLSHIGRDRAS